MSRQRTPASAARGRILSIDAIRGLAILMMFYSHGLHWFFTGTSHDIATIFGVNSIGDMATPMFYTISGIALYLSLTSSKKEQAEPAALHRLYAGKFAQLFLIGVLLSKSWGVLQAQAVSLWILARIFVSLKARRPLQGTMGVAPTVGVAALLSHHLIVSSVPPHHFLAGILRGEFPLFAILAVNAFGLYVGYQLRARGTGGWTGIAGAALAGAGLLLHHWIQPIERADMSLSFIAFGIGLVMLLLNILELPAWRDSRLLAPFVDAGRDTLFLFVGHYLVFFLPLYALGFINSFGRPVALVLSALFTLTMVRIAYWRKSLGITARDTLDWVFGSQPTPPALEENLSRLTLAYYQSIPMDPHPW